VAIFSFPFSSANAISSLQGLDDAIARDRLRDPVGQIYRLTQPFTHEGAMGALRDGEDLARRYEEGGYGELVMLQFHRSIRERAIREGRPTARLHLAVERHRVEASRAYNLHYQGNGAGPSSG